MTTGQVVTAGEVVTISYPNARVRRLIESTVGQALDPATNGAPSSAAVELRVETAVVPFDRHRLRLVTRDAWSDGTRTVLQNACGSGFDVQLVVSDAAPQLRVTARYRPGSTLRAANSLLSRRFVLLAGQTLLHYPVLWRAGTRDRVPLHVAVLSTAAGTPLLAGPGGVGKSTVIQRANAAAAMVTADNLCVGDGVACYGVAEPLRVDAISGRRGTTRGRTDAKLGRRTPELQPDRIVLLERGAQTRIEPVKPDEAGRYLVGGTYAAGELRRYWQFAATMAIATGLGPAHPEVTQVAGTFAESLPCIRVQVGDGDRIGLDELCGAGQ